MSEKKPVKPSRNNRGSTPDKESMDWRTPGPLVDAIEKHYDIKFVLDAAATPENSLCHAFITKGMDTLNMPMERIFEVFESGIRMAGQRTVQPINQPAVWCNPEYFSSQELYAWIEKGARFAHTYKTPWVFLLPASRTEQPWYQRAIYWRPQFCNPDGRVPFNRPDGTPG